MLLKKIYVLFLLWGLAAGSAASQIGGIVNKARNKAGEIRSIGNQIEGVKKRGNSSGSGSSVAGIENPQNSGAGIKEKVAGSIAFELAGQDGYDEVPLKYTIAMLDREKPIGPYRHIRKAGEKGSFHFAMDYRELDGIAEPALEHVRIQFSKSPFKEGADGSPQTTFNSTPGDPIYARIETGGASIREVFRMHEDGLKLTVDFYLYPKGGDGIKDRPGLGTCTLYLTSEQANKNFLNFDVKPALNNITPYYDSRDRYAFYIPYFSLMHSEEFFRKSGIYQVGLRLVSDVTDEWGKVTGKKLEVMGSFEYTMNISDAKAVFNEGQAVLKKLQNGMRVLPKPMPSEWKMASAASIIPGYNISKYNQLYQGFYKNVKIIKTVLKPVVGATWKIVSNDNIIPTYKYCTQTVYFFVKDADGNCYYHPCDLRQDYSGGGTYGPIHLAVFDEERVYVKCDEMK